MLVVISIQSFLSSFDLSLRSNYTLFLDCPEGRMLTTLDALSFYAATPTLWNNLTAHIREIESFGAFKKHVKTHLYRLAFK